MDWSPKAVGMQVSVAEAATSERVIDCRYPRPKPTACPKQDGKGLVG